jgi:hypothetical protein
VHVIEQIYIFWCEKVGNLRQVSWPTRLHQLHMASQNEGTATRINPFGHSETKESRLPRGSRYKSQMYPHLVQRYQEQVLISHSKHSFPPARLPPKGFWTDCFLHSSSPFATDPMFVPFLLASLGLLAAASDPPRPKPFDCGTDTSHASPDFLKTIASLHGAPNNAGSHAARAALVARDGPISVDAVFHMVATKANKPKITNAMPAAQLAALNAAYKPYDITFNLINVTWSTNDLWAVGDKPADDEMKKALRQGTYNTLNLYFQTDLTGGVLGRCTLPSDMAKNKPAASVYYNDGCNINANTMPAGAMNGYNAGMTAVHETGHWMGLLHTFEGYSCDGPGDYIDDTPVELTATNGCPTDPVKRSCPTQQKVGESDPIHNYMDYSIDSCYTGFTTSQVARMRSMWGLYRMGN